MASRKAHRPPGPPLAAAGDAELVVALRAGERAAAGELYRRQRARVAACLARRMVVGSADVEDVVQDTFLRLWDTAAGDADAVGEFDPATHGFGAWLRGRSYGRGVAAAARASGRAPLEGPRLDGAGERGRLREPEPMRDVAERARDRQTRDRQTGPAPGRWVA